MSSQDRVIAYTDGACKGNPGPGGWGALIRTLTGEIELFGGSDNVTNNQMELTAAIQVMDFFKDPTYIHIITDSEYLINGASKWIDGWRKRGWKTASGDVVKNVELWKKIDAYLTYHTITWKWVKGHSGDAGNERADILANKGIHTSSPLNPKQNPDRLVTDEEVDQILKSFDTSRSHVPEDFVTQLRNMKVGDLIDLLRK